MTAHARTPQADMPFSVRSLAERWSCSEGMIRKMIKRGDLKSFKLGVMDRIPAAEVERVECSSSQNTPSKGSGEGSPLSGPKTGPDPSEPPATGEGAPSTPPIGRARNPKRVASGREATIHRGPWAGS